MPRNPGTSVLYSPYANISAFGTICVNLHLSQAEMTERALELLCLPDEPCYLLDLGCGSGLSGECIEEQVIFIEDQEHIIASLVVFLGPQLGWS